MTTDKSENKTQHLHILMAPTEVDAIDEWGFKNRIRTRAEAIRRLCQMALVFEGSRDDLVEAYKAIFVASNTAVDAAFKALDGNEVSSDVKAALSAAWETHQELMAAYSLIRSIVSIPADLKQDGELERIFEEARDLAERARKTFRERRKGLHPDK